jgi:kinetochore protein NNF1
LRIARKGWISSEFKSLKDSIADRILLVSDSPHTLGANELYQAHLAPYLEQAQSKLDLKLEATKAQNAELSEKIQLQRQEIESLLSGLEAVAGDLEGAIGATSDFDSERNLLMESLQMDEEVKSSQEP